MEIQAVDSRAAPADVVESAVHRPGQWLLFLVGGVFSSSGIWFFATAGNHAPPGWPVVVLRIAASVFMVFGGIPLLVALSTKLLPKRIKHASPSVLSGVPTEPVIREGLVVHGRLTHELVQNDEGWELRPNPKQWRNDKRLFVGFGVCCLVAFSAILSWIFHREGGFPWPVAVVLAVPVVCICGGTALGLIALLTRAGYKRLATLNYSATRDELLLDSAREPSAGNGDVHSALNWIFSTDGERQQLTIPRDLVAAVQLCSWKYVLGSRNNRSTTWAVQGVLVLGPDEDGTYHRLPLLLTSDFVGAARLMQHLGETLEVPYLFHADAAGWAEEVARAKTRAPLKAGGTQT